MFLRITDQIFEQYPGVMLGVVIAHGIDNTGEDAEVIDLLQREETRVFKELANTLMIEHPHIAPWREAYRKFGAKPKEHPSSIENLVRRVLKGQTLPHINKLVDIYNTISLRFILPVGGEDLDKIEGDVLLTVAGEHEAPVHLLGEQVERPPRPGEVIYKDRIGAICRRWNWKEADRTKFTTATKNAFLVIEGLPPIDRVTIETAINELTEFVKRYCGGRVMTTMLDKQNPAIELRPTSGI